MRILKRQKRWKRSFLRNQGTISKAQKRAIRELWPLYGTRFEYNQQLDFASIFGREAPLVMEIGFGHGETLVEMALARPEDNFFGVEVHRPSLGATLKHIHEQALTNVRILRGDVIEVLQNHVDRDSFDEVCIFFPDPWLQEKDANRRLVRPDLLDLLCMRMKSGARLRFTSDIHAYALAVDELFHRHPAFEPNYDNPYRAQLSVTSKYQAKGLAEGRGVWHLEQTRLPGRFVTLE